MLRIAPGRDAPDHRAWFNPAEGDHVQRLWDKVAVDRVRSPKHRPPDTLVLDGSCGEGGGQILRTALSLAALAGRPLRVDNIRSRRPEPGLAAQHLTAVRAAAEICQANAHGAAPGSQSVNFVPTTPVRARDYVFDVSAARKGEQRGCRHPGIANRFATERFGLASIEIEAQPNGTAMIRVTPAS